MPDADQLLAEAKARLPLPALLHSLGLGDHARKSAKCPFHEDRHNSFSIWHNDAGKWFWKCHAGCGSGDEITLVAKVKGISIAEALKLFREMAGVAPPRSKAPPVSPPDWASCVEAFGDADLERLAEWRGYSGEFVSWLRQRQLVGLYEKHIAFPVHDEAGNVVGVHYWLGAGSWRYCPKGTKVTPLVIGELMPGDPVHLFESQWDGFAFLDASGERGGVVVTRGASNGALAASFLPDDSRVYLWPQNDAAGEKWAQDICAAAGAKVTLKRVKIPAAFKDLNDWTRGGKAVTPDDLANAMVNAEPLQHAGLEAEKATEQTSEPDDQLDEEHLPDFPIDALPPVLEREARAISELCGVPLGMSAPMVLATASASIGKGLRVRALPGRVTPANLFVLVCKTSGSGGSLTYKCATAPLVGMQKTLRREYQEREQPRIDAERASLMAQIEETKRALRKADENERQQLVQALAELNEQVAALESRVSPLLLATDVTPEKLADMLEEHDETLFHCESDASDALAIITGERYGGKHIADTLWLKAYTGEPTVIFRKVGKPTHLLAPCLTALFLVTPDKAQELFRNRRLTSGGLLPRFLVCDPAARPVPFTSSGDEDKHTLPTDAAQPYEAAIFKALADYRALEGKISKLERALEKAAGDEHHELLAELDALTARREIGVTPEAASVFIEDWNRFCAASNGTEDHPFEARHTENAIRIALVLHAFCHVDIEWRSEGTCGARMFGHERTLDARTARDALRIRDWFNLHQDALRKPQRAAASEDAWHKAQAMMRDRSPAIGITARDLYNNRLICGNRSQAEKFLVEWVREGRVERFQRKPAEGAGRPTVAYRLAPLGRR
jgi:hypothetical protein